VDHQRHVNPSLVLTEQGDSLLDFLDCGVALFNGHGQVVFWNLWLENHSGKSHQQMVGRTLRDVFADDLSHSLNDAIAGACRGGMAAVLSNQLHRHPLPLHRAGRNGQVLLEQSILVRPLKSSDNDQARAGARCVMQVSDVSSAVRRESHLRETQAQIRLRNRALEASSQGIIIVDAIAQDRPIIYANSAFARITGYSADEVMGRNCRFLQGPETEQPGLNVIRKAIHEQSEAITVVRNYRKDGTPFWNELLISPVFDAHGTLTNFVGVQRDITVRRRIEEQRDQAITELREANDRLSREEQFTATVLHTIGALVAVVDRRGRIVSFNRACEEATGLDENEAIGSRLADLIPESNAAAAFRLDQAQGGSAQGLRTGLLNRGGGRRIIRWTFSQIKSSEGTAGHLICTGIDITERERAYGLLEAERGILELVARAEPLDQLLDRLCLMVEGQLPDVTASLALLDAGGTRFERFIGPSLDVAYVEAFRNVAIGPSVGSCGAAAYHGRPHYTYDTMVDENWASFRPLAESLHVRCCWSVPVVSSTQMVLGTLAVHGDTPRLPDEVSMEVLGRAARIAAIAIERHRAEERIHHLALYDQLTGLANRTLLSDRLPAALRHCDRAGDDVALLFIDLDGFKPINDAHGHDAGDAVLEAIGQRLQKVLRGTDTAARIGGDEFVVLAEGVHGCEDAALIAEKVLEGINQPIQWHGKPLSVGASIGIALYPLHAQDADTLLTAADNAMYQAKEQGKNRWMMMSPAVAHRPEALPE
jgi:diguanylate cyclase (GGDEF)-like protein/PAS domain S-box-containing protein